MATDAALLVHKLVTSATLEELNAWVDALPASSIARLTAAVVRAHSNQALFHEDIKHNVMSHAIASDAAEWAAQRLAVARDAIPAPEEPGRSTRSKSSRNACTRGIQSLPHDLLVQVAQQLFPRRIQPRLRPKERAKELGRLACVAKVFQCPVAHGALSVVDEALRSSATWMAGRIKAIMELDTFDAHLYLTSLPHGSAALGATLLHNIEAFNGPRVYLRFVRGGHEFKRQGHYEISASVPTSRLLMAFCHANNLDSDAFDFYLRRGENGDTIYLFPDEPETETMESLDLHTSRRHPNNPEHKYTIAVRPNPS